MQKLDFLSSRPLLPIERLCSYVIYILPIMERNFAAEKTLGKLAKWLRILGFDTIYDPDIINPAESGRILLTRTKRIQAEYTTDKLVFIKSDKPIKQLQEVIKALEMVNEDIKMFTRCIRCNTKIRPINKNSIRSLVPDYVWENNDSFKACNECKRIYWQGSHTKRSMEIIKKMFEPIPKNPSLPNL